MSHAVPPPPPPRRGRVPKYDPLVTEPEIVLPTALVQAEELPTLVYVRPTEATKEAATIPGSAPRTLPEPAEMASATSSPGIDPVTDALGHDRFRWTFERTLMVVNFVLGIVVTIVIILLQGVG